MKHDLRFSGSDVLETFPMPASYKCEALVRLGSRFHEERASIAVDLGIGLTKLTNLVHSPRNKAAPIEKLRQIGSEIDTAVLRLFGWSDIHLDHGFHEVDYRPANDRLRFTISETARVEVLRRLSELNRQWYENEVAQGLHARATSRVSARSPGSSGGDSTAPAQPSLDFGAIPANEGRYFKVAEPRAEYPAGSVHAIAEYLSAHPGWHAKADVLAATSITDRQWNAAIADLIAGGRVERQGERRGARYRFIRGGSR